MKRRAQCCLIMLSVIGFGGGGLIGDSLLSGWGLPFAILGAAAPWLMARSSRRAWRKENPIFRALPSAETLLGHAEAETPFIPRNDSPSISSGPTGCELWLAPFIAASMLIGFLLSMIYNLAGFKGWIWIGVLAFLVSVADGGFDAWTMTLILLFGLPYAIIRWAIRHGYQSSLDFTHGGWSHEWTEGSIRLNPYIGEITTYQCMRCKKEIQSNAASIDLARSDCPGPRTTYRYDFNKDLRAKHPRSTSTIASMITDKRRDFFDDDSLEDFKQSFWPPYLIALFLFGIITDGVQPSGDNGIHLVLGVALVISGVWKAFWQFTLTGLALAFFIFVFSVGILVNGREAIVVSLIIIAFIAFLFFVVWRFMQMWHKWFGPG